ncbi:MAG: hypothetical protein KDE48_23715 [Anaerolineales bacterium]|nr:hypothetical protein [Anaerolineales bacterium]
MKLLRVTIVIGCILLLFITACGGDDTPDTAVLTLEAELAKKDDGSGENADPTPTNSENVTEPTAPATAEPPPSEAPTIASEPAPTPEPDPTNIAATAESVSIEPELRALGIDPAAGKLAWMHPPITLEVTDFEETAFGNQRIFTVASDFVLAADVTWNSAYAESGCGFVARSDGDEEVPSQYIIGLTRGAQGHVLFAEQIAGDVDLDHATDIYANGIDPNFEWQNDTTNRIAIVGIGQDFTLYSNGTKLGTVSATSGFEEGFVAFIAVNRSGGIRCQFNNAWLWRFN